LNGRQGVVPLLKPTAVIGVSIELDKRVVNSLASVKNIIRIVIDKNGSVNGAETGRGKNATFFEAFEKQADVFSTPLAVVGPMTLDGFQRSEPG
jgi:hypothetical protein